MDFESALRAELAEIAQSSTPPRGLAATALRRARRRTVMARSAVAGTAAAVTIPVGFTALIDDSGSASAGPSVAASTDAATQESDGPAATPTTDTATEEPAEPAAGPPDAAFTARELNDDELAAAFEKCADDPYSDAYADDWEPVTGFAFDPAENPVPAGSMHFEEAAPGYGTPVTWVIARNGDEFRADCGLNAEGVAVAGHFTFGYGPEQTKSDPNWLFELVEGSDGGVAGRYKAPVATVTVQYGDGPETQALTYGGFWFTPGDDPLGRTRVIDEDVPLDEYGFPVYGDPPSNDIMGVFTGYVYRGYSADGELLYDSSVDGPFMKNCYTDPTGTDIYSDNRDIGDPAKCQRSLQWEPIGLP